MSCINVESPSSISIYLFWRKTKTEGRQVEDQREVEVEVWLVV